MANDEDVIEEKEAHEENNPEIEVLTQQIEELEGKWKRALADYQNLQRHTQEERISLVSYATADIVTKFLDVFDTLENVQKHLNDQGLGLALKQFGKVLSDEGVQEIQALDSEFDPATMECIQVVEGKDGKVLSVVKKGYLLKDKVLRPALVTVGKKALDNTRNEDVKKEKKESKKEGENNG